MSQTTHSLSCVILSTHFLWCSLMLEEGVFGALLQVCHQVFLCSPSPPRCLLCPLTQLSLHDRWPYFLCHPDSTDTENKCRKGTLLNPDIIPVVSQTWICRGNICVNILSICHIGLLHSLNQLHFTKKKYTEIHIHLLFSYSVHWYWLN